MTYIRVLGEYLRRTALWPGMLTPIPKRQLVLDTFLGEVECVGVGGSMHSLSTPVNLWQIELHNVPPLPKMKIPPGT